MKWLLVAWNGRSGGQYKTLWYVGIPVPGSAPQQQFANLPLLNALNDA